LLHLRKENLPPASSASLPVSFYDSMARCAERLGLRRLPKVVLTRRVACPAVFGMFRPVLLMPVGYLSKMTRRDTENMLLHELAHIKRGDLWVHGFYMLLQVVYWYNPLLWLVRSQMHHLRELCCDATVARLLKERISEYRQTLIDVARRFLTKPTEPGLGLLGLFEDSNRLLVRLNWLKKETWRYQKMKKLTIITTIVLMLAFVLPMAQAQDKPATESSSADSAKAEEQPSQSTNTAEIEQEQKQNQQQLSQNMRELEVRLQQLQIEKLKLEKEFQAMVQAREAELQAAQAKIKAKEATLKAKEAKIKGEKASKEAEKVKDHAAKAKALAEAQKAETEAKRWEQWAKEMNALAERYQAQMISPEVQETYKRLANNMAKEWINSDEFKQWQKKMQQWAKEYAKTHEEAKSNGYAHATAPEPHPMPVMPPMPAMPAMSPMHVEVVAPDVVAPAPPTPPAVVLPTPLEDKNETNPLKERAGEVPITSGFIDNDLATEVLPALSAIAGIPIVADESVQALVSCKLNEVPLHTALEIVLAGTPYTCKKMPYGYLVYSRDTNATKPLLVDITSVPANNPRSFRLGVTENIDIKKDNDGKYVATTEINVVLKTAPGKPFIVRNNLGNIILRPSKDGTCDVRAIVRASAQSAAEAKEMAELVVIYGQALKEKFHLSPDKSDKDLWNNLSVDFHIAVPPGVPFDVKTEMGNIELSNLEGRIKAATKMGSIKAVNSTGGIELVTNLGDIEFVAPKNLSAKLQAQTKMGEIESELPLEIDRSDMFKRTAEGTIGTGQASIKMATDMGKINLKWQPSSQDELKL